MFQIDAMSRTPVYEQIVCQMERFITSGVLKPGDQLPSVRGLSIELRINPNTIQKAYSELDAHGVIHSVPGKGCFVCENAVDVLCHAKRKQIDAFSLLATELASAGIEEEELLACVRQACLKATALRKENES